MQAYSALDLHDYPLLHRAVKLTNADGTAYLGGRVDSHLFKEQLFGLSIFLFAQSLWRAAMRNDDLAVRPVLSKSSFK